MNQMESNELTSPHTEVGSLWDPAAREQAAELAHQGFPIGVYNRGVCAIWGNGAHPNFPESVARIKGEKRGDRPLAASMRTSDIVPMIDPEKIPPGLHDVFLVAETLAERTSSLCFIRVPITLDAAASLPPAMISWVDDTPIIQNWDPKGHKPTYLFVEKMREKGVMYAAVTSMNISGTPEVTDQQEGIRFSQQHTIPFFLTDPKDKQHVLGSYTILGVSQQGVALVRDGNIPGQVFDTLLETSLDTSHAVPSKYPQPVFSPSLLEGLDPKEARIAILSSLHDYPEEAIRRRLAKPQAEDQG